MTKIIIGFMKKTASSWVVVFIISLLCMLEGFFYPIIIRKITDDGMLKLKYNLIWQYAIILIVLILAVQGLETIQDCILLELRKKLLHKLHSKSFTKLLNLKINYFEKNNSAEILNQLNTDIDCIGLLFDKGFLSMLTYALRIISGFFGVFYINWRMACCIIICIPIKIIITRKLSEKKKSKYEKYIQENSDFFSRVADKIMGIREIKIQNCHKEEINKFMKEKMNLLNREKQNNLLDEYDTVIETLIQGVMTGVFYIIGGYYICQGQMSIGSVLAFISYSGNIMGPLSILIGIQMLIAQIKPSFQRLKKFWELEEEYNLGINKIEDFQTLELRSVKFGYDNKTILDDISLKMKRGEKIAIVGENGSGKSSLLSIILRLYDINEGEILINNMDAYEIELSQYRTLFSVVFQFPFLFQETIRKNLDYKNIFNDEEIIEVFSKMGVKKVLNILPQGLDSQIGVCGMNISGGEKQKLALVRAVLYSAPILIFDENTSNFDCESERWFFEKGIDLFPNSLIILITHQLQYVEKFDKVYSIKDGKIHDLTNCYI